MATLFAQITDVVKHELPEILLEIRDYLDSTIKVLVTSLFATVLNAGLAAVHQQPSCPGYIASNVQHMTNGLVADLRLAGPACNIYGVDLPELRLTVEYQTGTRLHVLVEDRDQVVYQVPQHILPRPRAAQDSTTDDRQLVFKYTRAPFSFSVSRTTGEILFDTWGSPLVFESQYLNLRTTLPDDPNLYGLGEHSDPFRLNTTNYTRTIWTRDAPSIPTGTNLYGAHPIYLEHRGANGSHGVVLVNSNGMDVKINYTDRQYLEYNVLGGVFDFYFVAGPSPIAAAQQISEIVGLPAMVPYSAFGFHNCRYGYQDIYQIAEVVHNYSASNIPLETMWTDIDYMNLRRVFTLDPERYPVRQVRELVDHLHAHQQKYVVMIDPAVGFNSTAYATGHSQEVFVKTANGSDYKGVVWPGVAAFPDWFHPNTQSYWTSEFGNFFNSETGVDIDFLWIDMNEPANFCYYPCSDPEGFAGGNGDPPAPPPVRDGPAIPLPGFPHDFQPRILSKRQSPAGSMLGLPGRELVNPPYTINNVAGGLSNRSLDTSLVHYGGLAEYDTHNLYGTMMSNASRRAMLSRRPGMRPLVVTRSTFLGAGSYAAHWLGDNVSNWLHYRISIAQMLQFASIFQLPMVGSDVCGFQGNTTEALCARWTMLGAFYPFYRNHNALGSISQEAYRWPTVAAAARYAIDIRYRLLDYIYTSFWQQSQDGTPILNPMFYFYPADSNTFAIENQFFYGNAVLVSPVVEENSTDVQIYLPKDIFYDWNNGFVPVHGEGKNVTLSEVGFQTIPLHVRGGNILPMRTRSANTTTELRKQPFHIVVAPGLNDTAVGSLYLDDGSMIEQTATSVISMTYDNGRFTMRGVYNYNASMGIEIVRILGFRYMPQRVTIAGVETSSFSYNPTTKEVAISCEIQLTQDNVIQIS